MKNLVFWDMMLCRLVGIYKYIGCYPKGLGSHQRRFEKLKFRHQMIIQFSL